VFSCRQFFAARMKTCWRKANIRYAFTAARDGVTKLGAFFASCPPPRCRILSDRPTARRLSEAEPDRAGRGFRWSVGLPVDRITFSRRLSPATTATAHAEVRNMLGGVGDVRVNVAPGGHRWVGVIKHCIGRNARG
jgi:hypothetical protein